MRLMTFSGPSLTEVMAQVRRDLGPDAVIISTGNRPGGGIEVRAAAEGPRFGEVKDAPRLRASRVTNILDTLRIAALAGPGGAVSGIRDALGTGPLRRSSADIYRLHGGFTNHMSAAEAHRLLALGTRLSRAAATGEGVVSHVHQPV